MWLCREFCIDFFLERWVLFCSLFWIPGLVLCSDVFTWPPTVSIIHSCCACGPCCACGFSSSICHLLTPAYWATFARSFGPLTCVQEANPFLSLCLSPAWDFMAYIFLEALCHGSGFPVLGHPSSVLHGWDPRGTGTIPGGDVLDRAQEAKLGSFLLRPVQQYGTY